MGTRGYITTEDFLYGPSAVGQLQEEIGAEAESSGSGKIVEVLVMGFVVEEIPFRYEVMFERAEVIVGVGECLDSRSEERVVFPDFESSPPDYLADFFRGSSSELRTFRNFSHTLWFVNRLDEGSLIDLDDIRGKGCADEKGDSKKKPAQFQELRPHL